MSRALTRLLSGSTSPTPIGLSRSSPGGNAGANVWASSLCSAVSI